MPRSTTARDVSRQRFGRSYSSEDITLEPTDSPPVSPVVSSMSGEGHGGSAGGPSSTREGPRLWSVVVLSALGSAAAVAAVGCFCALIYPILRGKSARARVTRGSLELFTCLASEVAREPEVSLRHPASHFLITLQFTD